jgi:hypothetical protein
MLQWEPRQGTNTVFLDTPSASRETDRKSFDGSDSRSAFFQKYGDLIVAAIFVVGLLIAGVKAAEDSIETPMHPEVVEARI